MEATNIAFVGEVEKYPELYDYTNPFYSRKDAAEKAWAKVGKKFNLTGMESKEKWRNLRNSFVKNLKPPAGGASARKKKSYYLSEAMQFTLPFVKVAVAGATSGYQPEMLIPAYTTPDPLSPECSIIEEAESLSDQTIMESSQPSPPPPSTRAADRSSTPPGSSHEEPILTASVKRRRDITACMDAEYILAKMKQVEAKQQVASVSGQSEALKFFLLSLIPDIEALPPSMIRAFKRRTLDLIEELTDEASPSTSMPPRPHTPTTSLTRINLLDKS